MYAVISIPFFAGSWSVRQNGMKNSISVGQVDASAIYSANKFS